jgi:hypothetical protein
MSTNNVKLLIIEIPDVISFVRDEHARVTHLLSNVEDVGKKIK